MPSVPFNPTTNENPFSPVLSPLEMAELNYTDIPPNWGEPPSPTQMEWVIDWCLANIPGYTPPVDPNAPT